MAMITGGAYESKRLDSHDRPIPAPKVVGQNGMDQFSFGGDRQIFALWRLTDDRHLAAFRKALRDAIKAAHPNVDPDDA